MATVYSAGTIILDTETRILSGPRGSIKLATMTFAILEKLMRRPEVVIDHSSLIGAVWENPDDEPEEPMNVIKDKIKDIRGAIKCLGSGGPRGATIKCERSVGYYFTTRATS